MANEKNVLGTAESTEVFNDYEFSPVPDEKKNTWKSQIFVWLGVGFCLTAFTLGGQIALGLGYSSSRIYWWYYSDTCRNTLWCHRCKEWSFFHSIFPIHIRKIWCNGVRNYCCTV